MKQVVIDLDFLIGPIVKDVYDVESNTLCTGVKVIDSDKNLEKINQEIQDEYSSLYEFDNGEAVTFDTELAKKRKHDLQKKVQGLLNYLEKINDGSFVVVDHATEYLKKL